MNFKFRQLERRDFEAVHKLALKGWYFAYEHLDKEDLKKLVDKYYSNNVLETVLKGIKSDKHFFILAYRGSRLVGYCNVTLKNGQGELLGLYIEPVLVGKGLGKKLLFSGEEFMKSHGLSRYFTFVNIHNKLGVKFYLRNGFKRLPAKDKDDEFESNVLWYVEKILK